MDTLPPTPIRNLDEMLRSLDVDVRPEAYVFLSAPTDAPSLEADAAIREGEGLTLVLRQAVAEAHELPTEPSFAWLTLTIHSSLEAIGLTAAFSTALADEGISCSVLAGFHHDHLLVGWADRDRAVAVLRGLRQASRLAGA